MALQIVTRYYLLPQLTNEQYAAWGNVPDQAGLWGITNPLGFISYASPEDAFAAVTEMNAQIATYDVDPPAYMLNTWQGIWDPDVTTKPPFPVTDTIS